MPFSRRAFLRLGAGAAALALPGVPAVAATRDGVPWDTLRGSLTGSLVLPSDSAYGVARQLHWPLFDAVSPQAVAYCATPDDVSACLRFAQSAGVPLAARSGGHSPAGYSTTTGLVVDVSRLDGVRLDGATVTVGAGAQQIDALTRLAPAGLALSGGSCPTVGIAGFLQGGGFGLLTREFGMSCDHLVSARVVLADGRQVRCSADEEPDLFWALRGGGGGNFGVVTEFELTPLKVELLASFSLTWDGRYAAALVAAWQEWVDRSPRALGTNLTVSLADAAPGTSPVVVVSGAWTGDPAGLEPVLDDLVDAAGTPPATRTTSPGTYHDTMKAIYGCAQRTAEECHRTGAWPAGTLPRGGYLLARSRMISEPLSPAGVEKVLAALQAQGRKGHSRSLNCAALGGRVNDVGRTETAYVHRDTRFLMLFADAMADAVPPREEQDAAQAWADAGFAAMDPLSCHETYQNYTDPALTDWRSAYYAENYARLSLTKRRYDPDRLFRFPQAID